MPSRTLLAVYAHPDDEGLCGGTLALNAAAGHHTVLVCATRGEVGQISDPILATPETLAEVRENELRCAAAALNIGELIFLDYRDSGMAGTAENADPRSFVNVPAEEVARRLVGIIRRIKPEVVLTFDPQGGYGHPDHIAIHSHTVAAFHAAGDDRQFPEEGPAWAPSRLFYPMFSRDFFLNMRNRMAELGLDTSRFDRFDEFPWPDLQPNVTVDVSAVVDAKQEAFNCHATQFGPDSPFRVLPPEIMRELQSRELFAQAWPEPAAGEQRTSLFEQ
jgi:LmbE family N-acetylglucosaminyl deacetylase